MSLGDILQLTPSDLKFTLAGAGDETNGIKDGDWDMDRLPFDATEKYRSVAQRYLEGKRWEETDLFTNIYRRRFETGGKVRGTKSIGELAQQYYSRVDGLYSHLKEFGFCLRVDGRSVPLPNVHIGSDGEPLLGNNGNHRIAMAKVLNLPRIFVKVQTQHAKAPSFKGRVIMTSPLLPEGADKIPAMTTDAERAAYYRLAFDHAPRGNVIEMGAWLGASTVYIAAGMRDSGSQYAFHTYDRFLWDKSHDRKAVDWEKTHPGNGYRGGARVDGSLLTKFKSNIHGLRDYVTIHQGEIRSVSWNDGPVSLMVLDAPKRVREISHVLTEFRHAIKPGTFMAWQDFAHFPSYEIVACISRLSKYLEFSEGIFPGTTAIFKVIKQWPADAVSEATLSLKRWNAADIANTWNDWKSKLPEPMRARFRCGAAMFLCDIGAPDDAVKIIKKVHRDQADEIMPKWDYLRKNRKDMVARYSPLFQCLA